MFYTSQINFSSAITIHTYIHNYADTYINSLCIMYIQIFMTSLHTDHDIIRSLHNQRVAVADLGGNQGCARTPLWTLVNYYS